jgi:wyosine [tRNA(Phe)-imidazoG37] synthetase (radical SAM superfamily)
MEQAWRRHERRWRHNRFVYAVVSRRSGGVSIGVNLNPDKACNFDCVYCQVNRAEPPLVRRVDLAQLETELDLILQAERDGSLYEVSPFNAIPAGLQGVRDIAFSGDGEPTTYTRFADALRIAADARRRFGLETTKIVLITDAAYLHKPAVREGLDLLDQNNGEIWAKLDAGTEEHFQRVDRPNVSLSTVVENILGAARVRPVVIQTLWLRLHDEPPPWREIEAYCTVLNSILEAGGQLKYIQLYTIARDPAETFAAPLSDAELDAVAAVVRQSVPVPVETYYGVSRSLPDTK